MKAKPTATATGTVRDRKRSRGTIGCAPRAWEVKKAASATTATTNAATTRGAVNPSAPASIAPYVSPPIARMAVTCPTQSNGTLWCGERAVRASSSSATAPTGRLIQKIIRQLTNVRRAPSTGPEEDASAPPIAHIATARARLVGSGCA